MDACLTYYNHPGVIETYVDWHVSCGGSDAAVFRALTQRLFNNHAPYKNGVLVDICSGPGTSIFQLHPLGFSKFHAIDGAPNMLAHVANFAKQNRLDIHSILMDLQNQKLVPLDAGVADMVSLGSGIMYFESLDYLFSEAMRLLKKDGIFAANILVCSDDNRTDSKFKDEDDINTYIHSRSHVAEVVQKHGFVVADKFDGQGKERSPTGRLYSNIDYLFKKI